jgi:hypothetical protein
MFFHILKIRPMTYIKIVVLIRKEWHNIIAFYIADYICLHEYAVRFVPSYKAWPNITLIILKNINALMISLTQRRFLALTSPNESSLPNLDWSLAFFRLLRLFN